MRQLSSITFFISSFGLPNTFPGVRFWVSLLGIPLSWLLQFVYSKQAGVFAGIVVPCIVALLFIASYARRHTPEQKEIAIVLDRVLGVAIALLFLPKLTLKFALFGFCLFHSWLFVSRIAQQVYASDQRFMHKEIVLVTNEIILLAVFSNILLRFIWWVAH